VTVVLISGNFKLLFLPLLPLLGIEKSWMYPVLESREDDTEGAAPTPFRVDRPTKV
jgi:hypothetical protein